MDVGAAVVVLYTEIAVAIPIHIEPHVPMRLIVVVIMIHHVMQMEIIRTVSHPGDVVIGQSRDCDNQ